jgi:hypothetical protein
MDQRRERYTQELADANKRVRAEPHPDGSTVWDYVFADKNLVGGEA